jgi:hypothetical protein
LNSTQNVYACQVRRIARMKAALKSRSASSRDPA